MKNKIIQKALIVLCVGSLVAGTAGCSKTADKNIITPKPTKEVVDYNEEETSNLGLWTRAMGSVLIYLNDGNPYYFGGYQATEDNKNAAVNILSSSWNINSRKDLLTQIQNLLSEGDRMDFRKEAKEMNAMSKKQLKTAMKQLSGDLLIHYQMVQYNWKTWQNTGLLAWDMCRVSHLVQWGYVAGYINREEAQALIEPAAVKLQKKFSSWEEVQNNWLDGYCLFAGVDPSASNTDYTNRKALYENLVKEQPKNKPLYDDSLFTTDIIPVSGVSYQAILDEIKEDGTDGKKASKKDAEENTKKKTKTENTQN